METVYEQSDDPSSISGDPRPTPHPGATVSLSGRIQILLVFLGLSLLCALCALGVMCGLYVIKSNQLEAMEAIHSSFTDISASKVNISKSCAERWVSHGGKCYFFSTDVMNWTQSRDKCVSMGGHLVIINSQAEQDFLSSRINFDHWIGLNDLETEGIWLWVDKQPLSQTGVQFWLKRCGMKSEPDNWILVDPSGENCASLVYEKPLCTVVWYDFPCKLLIQFVCEANTT